MADTRYLLQKHRAWFVRLAVPRDCQPAIGKLHMLRSLGTADLRAAQRARHAVVAEWEALFARVRKAAADPVAGGAEALRRALAEPVGFSDATDPTDARHTVETAVDEQAAELPVADADRFLSMVAGDVPMLSLVDAWLAEGGARGPLNPRTAKQYRTDVTTFAAFCKREGVGTLRRVDRRVVGRWAASMIAAGQHVKTSNRRLSAASAYWRWLRKRGHTEAEPFAGATIAKGRAAPSKRPFTDTEVAKLLAADAGAELNDVMRLAALSGMRIEELYRLTVADCADGWFRVRVAKTAAGVRKVPIHSGLAAIVERRSAGKAPSAYLIHEAGPAPEIGRERSMAASQRFGRWRQTVGVHERADDERSSAVDFHSWRRWFVSSARDAGIDEGTVAAVVGHKVQSITSRYRGGVAAELLKQCVEAVKLPGAER